MSPAIVGLLTGLLAVTVGGAVLLATSAATSPFRFYLAELAGVAAVVLVLITAVYLGVLPWPP